jgi:hypothetical protein
MDAQGGVLAGESIDTSTILPVLLQRTVGDAQVICQKGVPHILGLIEQGNEKDSAPRISAFPGPTVQC